MLGAHQLLGATAERRRLGRARSVRAGPKIDARLRERFRAGDPEAVRVVYRAYGSLVHGVAFRVLGDRGLCEEATQQTFLRAWRAAADFDASRELGPWLATIARRVAIDLHRRETIRTAAPLESVAADDPGLVEQPFTDSILEVWEVRRAVSRLPHEQQEVIRLQHFEGLAHEQIAGRLGVPVGTVKSRSYRAHRWLAIELGHLREGDEQDVRDHAGHEALHSR